MPRRLMKILVIDNYDSFTFNLVQLIGRFSTDITVCRNDRITLSEIRRLQPERILISPGPGRPEDSNICLKVIEDLGREVPILGVCLGHQSIAITYGSRVIRAPRLMHGKTSLIRHDGKTIFKNIRQNFQATRYHSLAIERSTLSGNLEISAETDDGIIMGVRHKQYAVEGIQFHPESFLTPEGSKIIQNWLEVI
jgi:anthranilate synthase/aminodeoxychorismate synthase-like glutamine amidotransferase